MKRIVKPPRPAQAPPAPEPRISGAERAELQRMGAKAAARGEPTDSNPLDQSCNQPLATGESADKWSQRSDAWEQGHDAQSAAGRKAEPADRRKSGEGHD